MVESPLPSETLERLSAALTESLGLSFHGDRLELLQRRISCAAGELNFQNINECAQTLISLPHSRKQIEILAKHLTVGETYFFRDPGVFETLGNHILPELILKRQATTRKIRLWCAACCTGEEAYSLAMLIDKLIGDSTKWDISILATDVNPEFVERAKVGLYSERSLRTMPEFFRTTCMKKVSTSTGKKYQVAERLKSLITFSWMNLIEASSTPPLDSPADIIFCRNVFVYFAPAQTRKVLLWLQSNLADDGLLFVAPNEVFSAANEFEILNIGGVLTLAKRNHAPIAGFDASSLPLTSPGVSITPAHSVSTIESNEDTDNFLLMCRSAVSRGKLDEAMNWCERAIQKEPLNPSAYYLKGMIAQQRDDPDQAIIAMKRVLFLEPHFVMAQFALANLMLQEGRSEQSRKYFKGVLRSLSGYDGLAILPQSDGINAATMKAIVGAVLADYSLAHPEHRKKEGGGVKNVHRGQ